MTNEEIDAFLDLLNKDSNAAFDVLATLSPEDHEQIQARALQVSKEKIRQKFEGWEADGTMDEIRALYAEDQKKNKKRNKRK